MLRDHENGHSEEREATQYSRNLSMLILLEKQLKGTRTPIRIYMGVKLQRELKLTIRLNLIDEERLIID